MFTDEPVGYKESKYATPRERAESLGAFSDYYY